MTLLKWQNLPWNFHIGSFPLVTTSNRMWSPSFKWFASRISFHPFVRYKSLLLYERNITFHDLCVSSDLTIKLHSLKLNKPFANANCLGINWNDLFIIKSNSVHHILTKKYWCFLNLPRHPLRGYRVLQCIQIENDQEACELKSLDGEKFCLMTWCRGLACLLYN